MSVSKNHPVVYLNYSSIPAWAELGPAQPQLVLIFIHKDKQKNATIYLLTPKLKILIADTVSILSLNRNMPRSLSAEVAVFLLSQWLVNDSRVQIQLYCGLFI